uniref:Activin_recp domain-containing protein n=1 Tax=Ascaris lumbricoides TaxID=6252 RepID=A0A0M3IMB0_ASCLU
MRSVSYAANISCLRTKITALAQGCSSGLFDEIPSDYKCIDRDIPMRGRGGCFTLKAKYCFCWGDVCTEYNEIWMKHNPNPISIPNPRPNEMQPIASDYSLNQHNYAYHAAATSSSTIDPITLTYHIVIIVFLGYIFV